MLRLIRALRANWRFPASSDRLDFSIAVVSAAGHRLVEGFDRSGKLQGNLGDDVEGFSPALSTDLPASRAVSNDKR